MGGMGEGMIDSESRGMEGEGIWDCMGMRGVGREMGRIWVRG